MSCCEKQTQWQANNDGRLRIKYLIKQKVICFFCKKILKKAE